MKTQNIDCHIKNVDVFKELSPGKIEELKLLFTTKKYKKRTLITEPGERGKVYVVKSGRIELYEDFPNGKKFIFSILEHGRIFGDFDLDIAPTVYAKAIDDSEVCEISTKAFIILMLSEPKLLLKLFKYFFARLLIFQKKAASFASDDVFHRLVKLLLFLGQPQETAKFTEMITDKFTHEQLSQMLGVSRQTVTTMLSSLQKKGVIKRKKKSFLFDREKLKKLSE